MSTPTRVRILDYLRKQQTASVQEMSRALAMTGANIRHHLALLGSTDMIEVIDRKREGPGRPVNIYGLSRRVLGNGLEKLAGAMLEVWLRHAPEPELEAGLKSMAQQLGGASLPTKDIQLTYRLSSLVDRLNELQYQSRWEAGVNGPNVILGHCPYAAIIASNPELCRMDAFLLEQGVGSPVEQTAKLRKSVKGYPYCAFQVTGSR